MIYIKQTHICIFILSELSVCWFRCNSLGLHSFFGFCNCKTAIRPTNRKSIQIKAATHQSFYLLFQIICLWWRSHSSLRAFVSIRVCGFLVLQIRFPKKNVFLLFVMQIKDVVQKIRHCVVATDHTKYFISSRLV